MPEHAINGAIITFFSTASAVGKTLISCNMASELAHQGARVCLVDLDLQFGDVCNYLHILPERTLADVQRGMKEQGASFRIEEYLTGYRYDKTIFYVLAAPKELAEAYNIEVEPVKKAIAQLQTIFDYIIIDTTSMFSVLNLAMLDISTIVTYMGIVDFIPTIKNMKIGSDTMKSLNYDKNKIRFVLNRSDAKTRIGIEDVEQLLQERFYHILPNDFQSANQSIKDGVPLVLRDDGNALSKALRQLVYLYTNRDYEEQAAENSSWLSKLFR